MTSAEVMASRLGLSVDAFKALVRAMAWADLEADPGYQDFLDLERWADEEAVPPMPLAPGAAPQTVLQSDSGHRRATSSPAEAK